VQQLLFGEGEPHEGILKLNSDGAFFSHEKSGGWGFVIRNDRVLSSETTAAI
jgi:ribonuclease HI